MAAHLTLSIRWTISNLLSTSNDPRDGADIGGFGLNGNELSRPDGTSVLINDIKDSAGFGDADPTGVAVADGGTGIRGSDDDDDDDDDGIFILSLRDEREGISGLGGGVVGLSVDFVSDSLKNGFLIFSRAAVDHDGKLVGRKTCLSRKG